MRKLSAKHIEAQKKFHLSVKMKVIQKGKPMAKFYKDAGISPAHWCFIGKGTRPLTRDLKVRVLRAINHTNGKAV